MPIARRAIPSSERIDRSIRFRPCSVSPKRKQRFAVHPPGLRRPRVGHASATRRLRVGYASATRRPRVGHAGRRARCGAVGFACGLQPDKPLARVKVERVRHGLRRHTRLHAQQERARCCSANGARVVGNGAPARELLQRLLSQQRCNQSRPVATTQHAEDNVQRPLQLKWRSSTRGGA